MPQKATNFYSAYHVQHHIQVHKINNKKNNYVWEKKNPTILYMIQNNYNALPTMNMSMTFDSHNFLSLINYN